MNTEPAHPEIADKTAAPTRSCKCGHSEARHGDRAVAPCSPLQSNDIEAAISEALSNNWAVSHLFANNPDLDKDYARHLSVCSCQGFEVSG